MSRAFVKESDQEEAPIIPARAPLPLGVTNYVTPTGFAMLEQEKTELEAEKKQAELEDPDEQRRKLTIINARMLQLVERINSAKVIDLKTQPQDEVRFGATIEVLDVDNNEIQQFQIVGVDEADAKQAKIAFISPIARALNGLWVNEEERINLGKKQRTYRVKSIKYGQL